MASETRSTWVNIGRAATLTMADATVVALTIEMFDEIVCNAKLPLNVDYNFDTLRADVSGAKPSAGAIRELKRVSSRLWAFVEWSEYAMQKICVFPRRSYCVTAINLDARDRIIDKPIGAKLIQCALTTEPLDPELYPIQFGDRSTP